jgi:hypothetical protein
LRALLLLLRSTDLITIRHGFITFSHKLIAMTKNKKATDPVDHSGDESPLLNTQTAGVPDGSYNERPEDPTYNPQKSDGKTANFTDFANKNEGDHPEALATDGGMNRPVREKGAIAEDNFGTSPVDEVFKSSADGKWYRHEGEELVEIDVNSIVPASFNRADMIAFGNYLLSEKRRKKINWATVHDNDIEIFYATVKA